MTTNLFDVMGPTSFIFLKKEVQQHHFKYLVFFSVSLRSEHTHYSLFNEEGL